MRRGFDLLVSIAALAFFLPLLVLIALSLKLLAGGPVLSAEPRLGMGGRPFGLLKFRTAPSPSGRGRRLLALLAASQLDELPAFLNILRGDLSLVGPQPLAEAQAPAFAGEFDRYCQVRPGLTGPGRLSGAAAEPAKRLALDIDYASSRSFVGDLRLLARAAAAFLVRDPAD